MNDYEKGWEAGFNGGKNAPAKNEHLDNPDFSAGFKNGDYTRAFMAQTQEVRHESANDAN